MKKEETPEQKEIRRKKSAIRFELGINATWREIGQAESSCYLLSRFIPWMNKIYRLKGQPKLPEKIILEEITGDHYLGYMFMRCIESDQ